MIVDSIENFERYTSLHPLFPLVAQFMQTHDLPALAIGKIELKGTELVVNVQHPAAKTKEEARLETHRDFIDIQIPLSATETMGYTPATDCQPKEAPYDADKDITFFEGKAQSYLPIRPGMFAIFFPEDGHAPAITEAGVRKLVIKVKNITN
jgi:YhcH/YjgK/YiaL family protein